MAHFQTSQSWPEPPQSARHETPGRRYVWAPWSSQNESIINLSSVHPASSHKSVLACILSSWYLADTWPENLQLKMDPTWCLIGAFRAPVAVALHISSKNSFNHELACSYPMLPIFIYQFNTVHCSSCQLQYPANYAKIIFRVFSLSLSHSPQNAQVTMPLPWGYESAVSTAPVL